MYLFSKRLFDILLSFIAILVFSLFLVIIAIAVAVTSRGPIFYRAKRAAMGGGTFYLLKFRTMHIGDEYQGGHSTAIDDPRFTIIAKFLRKYKLDELPQLINVLLGDMSLVGPRPQVTYYTDKYIGEEISIMSVKPGITDFASIYFVDMDATLGNIDVDAIYETEIEPIKNKLRIKYVKEQSFIVDIKILIETVFKIFGIRNITGLNIK